MTVETIRGFSSRKVGEIDGQRLADHCGQEKSTVGRIQERYGLAKEEAERDADALTRELTNVDAER